MTNPEKKYRNGLSRSVHLLVSDLHKAGALDKATMRRFGLHCLTPVKKLDPEEIKNIREGAQMSQATFALALNVHKLLVSKWERGESKPTGATLKLLALASTKGIDAIL